MLCGDKGSSPRVADWVERAESLDHDPARPPALPSTFAALATGTGEADRAFILIIGGPTSGRPKS